MLFFLCYLFSCTTDKDSNCGSDAAWEINLKDTLAGKVMISPLDPGKLIVSFGEGKMIEIDKNNGNQSEIPTDALKILGKYKNIYHKDKYDSILYIITSDETFSYYQKSKIILKLPFKFVTNIVSRPDAIFFAERNRIVRLDRKSGVFRDCTDSIYRGFHYSDIPNDSTIILASKYTFNFNTGKLLDGIYFGKYRHQGDFFSYKSEKYETLFRKNDSLWLFRNGQPNYLFLPNSTIENTKIIDDQAWQENNNVVTQYDLISKKWWTYKLTFPNVNNETLNYSYDAGYIWAQRNDQIMLVDTLKGKHFQYPVTREAGFKNLIYDECNVYIMFKNKLVKKSKLEFIKSCKYFDFNKYNKEIEDYELYIYQNFGERDTSLELIKSKFNLVNLKFGNLGNVDINNRIQQFQIGAISSIKFSQNHSYQECYNDKELTWEHQRKCLELLLDKYVLAGDYDKGLLLENEFRAKFDSNGFQLKGLQIKFDSLKRYLIIKDSLSQINMASDSLFYFNAISLETIALTMWYCSEGCGGCDMHLVTDQLKLFLKKFPTSKLSDNAKFYLEMDGFDYMEGETDIFFGELEVIILVLKKYPDSEVVTAALNALLESGYPLIDMEEADFENATKRIVNSFPSKKAKMNELLILRKERRK